MEKKRKLSLTLAQALHDTEITTRDMEPTQVLSAYDKLEAAFLPKVASDPKLVVEMQRRIAENKFLCLSSRNLPFAFILTLFQGVREIGYTNLEKKINMEIIFARYCLRQNEKDKSKIVLEKLLKEIDQALKIRNLVYLRETKKKVQTLLGEISQ